jgi:hypothetical protein
MNIKLYEAVSYKNYEEIIPQDIYSYLISLDPTKDKGYKYANWIIQKVLAYAKSQNLDFNLMSSIDLVRGLLEKDFTEVGFYHHLDILYIRLAAYYEESQKKTFPPQYKNIFDFKTLESFLSFMNTEFLPIIEKSKETEAFKVSTILYKDENKILIIPKTSYSSWYFGQDTEWCTSRKGSDSYFNSYTEAGTIFIYAIFDKDKNRYDGKIQMFIPNEEGRRLAECRDARDKTIFSGKLFSQFDSTIISKLQRKWEDLEDSNTDQWEEGTGYLDPDIVSPEEEEFNTIEERILEIIELNPYPEEDADRVEYNLSLVYRQYDINTDGELVSDVFSETEKTTYSKSLIYKGRDFFKPNNPLAMEVIKQMVDPENVDDDDVQSIPDLLQHSQVHYFEKKEYPVSVLLEKEFSSYDTEDEEKEVSLKFKEEFGAIITICDRYYKDTTEDVYYSFNIADEPMIKCKRSREMAYDIEFEGRQMTIIINVIENRGSGEPLWEYPKFLDSNLAKFGRGELDYIRDDAVEAKYGQQFMKYEHKKLMNYLKKFYEKRNPVNLTKSKKLITLREER